MTRGRRGRKREGGAEGGMEGGYTTTSRRRPAWHTSSSQTRPTVLKASKTRRCRSEHVRAGTRSVSACGAETCDGRRTHRVPEVCLGRTRVRSSRREGYFAARTSLSRDTRSRAMPAAGPTRNVAPGPLRSVRALQNCWASATAMVRGDAVRSVHAACKPAFSKPSLPGGTSRMANARTREAISPVGGITRGKANQASKVLQNVTPGSTLYRAKSRTSATRSLLVDACVWRAFFQLVFRGRLLFTPGTLDEAEGSKQSLRSAISSSFWSIPTDSEPEFFFLRLCLRFEAILTTCRSTQSRELWLLLLHNIGVGVVTG